MTQRLPGLSPGDFAWIAAHSGLDQPEPAVLAPFWAQVKGKTQLEAQFVAPRRATWRGHPSLAAVSYQGKTATCVAHAACRMIETWYRQQGRTISLNAECAHECIYRYPSSLPAAQASNVLDELRAQGAPQAPGFLPGVACPTGAALGLVPVPLFRQNVTIAQLKAKIAESGPALAVLTLAHDFENLAAPFVYHRPAAGSATFNHAVMLIGYDDDDGGGMWACQNSFGAGWGDHGYFLIPYADASVMIGELHPTFSLD